MDGLYYGTVQQVFPPGSTQNLNKYQYEYSLVVTMEDQSQMPVAHAIRRDEFGSADDFDDAVLDVNQKVLVMFPRGRGNIAIIMGAIRNSPIKTADAMAYHCLRRFNGVEVSTDKDGNWKVKSDKGPNLQVNIASIVLDDSAGESITLDKAGKVLTIKANKLVVQVQGDASVEATGAVSVKAKSLSAEVGGEASIKAKSLTANVDGDARIKAKGNCEVDGAKIELNGGAGKIVTTATHPVDFVTGIPIQGVPTVKAG